jgi:hypothetical protein
MNARRRRGSRRSPLLEMDSLGKPACFVLMAACWSPPPPPCLFASLAMHELERPRRLLAAGRRRRRRSQCVWPARKWAGGALGMYEYLATVDSLVK